MTVQILLKQIFLLDKETNENQFEAFILYNDIKLG